MMNFSVVMALSQHAHVLLVMFGILFLIAAFLMCDGWFRIRKTTRQKKDATRFFEKESSIKHAID